MTSMLISRAKGERISQVGLWGLFSSRVGRISAEDTACQAVSWVRRSGTRPFNTCQSVVKPLAFVIKKEKQIVLLGLACAT